MSREDSKIIRDLREENKKLKSSISCMQSDITDKNSKTAQLNIANMKLSTRNNYLTELCAKDKLYERDREIESEEEDEGSERQRRKIITEEYKGQGKKTKIL